MARLIIAAFLAGIMTMLSAVGAHAADDPSHATVLPHERLIAAVTERGTGQTSELGAIIQQRAEVLEVKKQQQTIKEDIKTAAADLEAQREAEAQRAAEEAAKPPAKPELVRPCIGDVTSPFGMRVHPITGVKKLHTGTDFGAGDFNARAAKDGTVISAGMNGGYGKMVIIDHGGGAVTRYAHLETTKTKPGREVEAGDRIGIIGTTGMSTGPHLHFEVLIDGEFVDPLPWLDGADTIR